MERILRNKGKTLLISTEIALILWAVWTNLEYIVEDMAMILNVSIETMGYLIILQGILVLFALGAFWRLFKRG